MGPVNNNFATFPESIGQLGNLISTIDTPIKKMTPKDWAHQKVKWAQESTRQLYEQTQFNLTPQFQDINAKNEEWNPRKDCDLYCLNPTDCLGISDVAMARTMKILKEKTLREWLIDSLQDVVFPPLVENASPPKIQRVWMQLERENRKDSKSAISLPIRTFCSAIHFLREAKGISSNKLEYIRQEFIRQARISYVDELSLLAQKYQIKEEKAKFKGRERRKSKQEKGDDSQTQRNENKKRLKGDSPLTILTQFVKGNITEFGFFTQQEANQFFLERKLGRLSKFSSSLKRAIQAANNELNCRIAKVAVPSFTGTKLIHVFARETDPNRKNSFERAIHRYFIIEISRVLQDMGHILKRSHGFPDGHLDDICVESGHTGKVGRIEIKTGSCANIRKQAFPQTKEAYLIIVPWRTKISRRRAKAAVPRAQLDYLSPVMKQLGVNYASLACDDPDFLAKLNAWANTGLLERAIDDPAHQRKEKLAIL